MGEIGDTLAIALLEQHARLNDFIAEARAEKVRINEVLSELDPAKLARLKAEHQREVAHRDDLSERRQRKVQQRA